MKLKKFSKVLIALCFTLLVVGTVSLSGAFASKSIAGIDGGVMEKAVRIIHFNF